jgi:polysaccharide export outer membrane protein
MSKGAACQIARLIPSLLAAALAAVALFPGAGLAQDRPTPEQLEAFQRMSPDQQRAIAESLDEKPRSLSPMSEAPGGSRYPRAGSQAAVESDAEPEELRVEPDGTLVIEMKLPDEDLEGDLDEDFLESFNKDIYRKRLLGSGYFEVDKEGILELPGIASIPLGGLTADEAKARLEAEPLLRNLLISVKILPLSPLGEAALKPFGYTLFEERPDLFGATPPQSVPVPRDYVLGPGDSLRVQLYGDDNYEVELEVTTEGTINFPKIGPQSVAGMTFGEVKEAIERRTRDQIIGTQAAVSMGRLKTIRVFVVGDVKRPGAYDVSSLSRITSALYRSGGVTEVGSLRRVQLLRNGKTRSTLDLYDLLLKGDTRADMQLQSDDVILIPPIGTTVGVTGEVRRPAIYELDSDRSLANVIRLAGGLNPTADRRRLQLERISDTGARRIETLNYSDKASNTKLIAGDLLVVHKVLDDVDGAVAVAGHVTRPGSYEWFSGMRIVDLLPNQQYLKPQADLNYVLIRRELGPERKTIVVSADLGAAQADPASDANIPLAPRDKVTVFELGIARSATIAAVLDQLNAQSSSAQPFQVVGINGEVNAPAEYPLEQGMRVSDLLRAGGGLKPSAYQSTAELTRYVIGADGSRTTELYTVDLQAALAHDPGQDLLLRPYDILTVQLVPEWNQLLEVTLTGEFRFPGTYPVRRGETLSGLIERAGGLTEMAFADGTVFTREFLKEREAQQLELLRTRLQSDLSALSLQRAQTPEGGAAEAYSLGQTLLEELRTTEAQGRLVIDLPAILANAGDLAYDIVLRDGDELVVPPRSQEVTVIGEVQYATSHRHAPNLDRNSYIDLSGGLTVRADKKRIYIVRANGEVVAGKGSKWFRDKRSIMPGDTVVVPLDTDRLPAVTQWASITQILFNLAIAAAAVNSF